MYICCLSPILSTLECRLQEAKGFILFTAVSLDSRIMFTSILILLAKWNDHENRPILSYAILLHNRTFLKLKLIFSLHDLWHFYICLQEGKCTHGKIPGFGDFLQTYVHDWLVQFWTLFLMEILWNTEKAPHAWR